MTDPVAELHARCRQVWPDLVVEPARFAAELERRLGESWPAAVPTLHTDVMLAIAACDGAPTAAAACETACELESKIAAARLEATPTQADDLLGELRRLLFTGDGARPAAIQTFSGRGDLRGFLRVIAARALMRRMQRDRREVELDYAVFESFSPVIDPEVTFVRETHRAVVDAAFRAALAALSDRSRALLRYHVIEQWTIDEIGARYGVHRATAARWLAAARDDLGARIRADLVRRLAITESQVDSIVALVTSRIEVSLERLLGGS